jgi:hypothetical protein
MMLSLRARPAAEQQLLSNVVDRIEVNPMTGRRRGGQDQHLAHERLPLPAPRSRRQYADGQPGRTAPT